MNVNGYWVFMRLFGIKKIKKNFETPKNLLLLQRYYKVQNRLRDA